MQLTLALLELPAPPAMPGATPNRKRTVAKLVDPVTKAVAPAKRPQVIMMRAIQAARPLFIL